MLFTDLLLVVPEITSLCYTNVLLINTSAPHLAVTIDWAPKVNDGGFCAEAVCHFTASGQDKAIVLCHG